MDVVYRSAPIYKLTRKHLAWGVRLQRRNLKRLAGVCINGGVCGLIRQSTLNLTNAFKPVIERFYLTFRNGFNWYCMAVVSLCCEM
jgi:hypothetical protein